MKSFTLIETIITITIFALAMGAISGLIMMGYRTQSYTWQQSQAIDEARRGIEIMVKEIREARIGDNGAYPIELVDNDRFVFYSNIDKDNQTEWVRYSIDEANKIFKKEVIKPEGSPLRYPDPDEEPDKMKTYIISQYVQNKAANPDDYVFTYFDGDYNPLGPYPARLKDTKLMHLYLRINVDTSRSPQDFILEAGVQIRNLKTNL